MKIAVKVTSQEQHKAVLDHNAKLGYKYMYGGDSNRPVYYAESEFVEIEDKFRITTVAPYGFEVVSFKLFAALTGLKMPITIELSDVVKANVTTNKVSFVYEGNAHGVQFLSRQHIIEIHTAFKSLNNE